ncbi:DUF1963 domain-containing protein [Blastopirellula marina]|nr:DUF1963 domain-containing protein [Blastopirellula marina]
MNYEFNLEEWLLRCPLTENYGHYHGEAITSPCDLCNNEWLRREIRDQFDWGEPVPMDVFVHSIGEPENRFATKIGGLPYRPAELPWPTTREGRSMALIAQFNFSNSRDIVGDLPGDLLLIFGDDADGPIEPLHFEWQPLGLSNLVSELPGDQMPISPCFGHRCRTVSYPNATYRDDSPGKDPQCQGTDVWSSYWLLQYQATQIGRAPFFIQDGDEDMPGVPLCTIASVQPDPHKTFPWVNHPEPLCPEDEWRSGDGELMIGDLGCIFVFIDDDGRLHADESCY